LIRRKEKLCLRSAKPYERKNGLQVEEWGRVNHREKE
jgi:hypothetical protein